MSFWWLGMRVATERVKRPVFAHGHELFFVAILTILFAIARIGLR